MNFIEKLQNKPHYIRVQIFWISVILAMAIIIFIWLIFLKSSLELSEVKQEPVVKEEESVPSLLGTLKEDFSIFAKTLQAGIKGILESGQKEIEFEAGIRSPQPSKLPE